MSVEQLLAFNPVLAAAVASPGPALLLAAQTVLGAGRRSCVMAGVGLACMAATWTGLALLGLGAVFATVPALALAMKIAGACYLLLLARGMWRESALPTLPVPARRAFRQCIMVNLLNPKSVLFAAAVPVAIVPSGLGVADSVLVVANHLLVELCFYSGLALLLNTRTVAERSMRARLYIDRGAAILLAVLALRLLVDQAWVSLATGAIVGWSG